MTRSVFLGSVVGAGVAAMLAYKAMHRNRRLTEQFAHDDELVNQAVDDSFPASDPPSYTPTSGSAVDQRER